MKSKRFFFFLFLRFFFFFLRFQEKSKRFLETIKEKSRIIKISIYFHLFQHN